MASIVLGVAASHSTLMNTHWDKVVHTERVHNGNMSAEEVAFLADFSEDQRKAVIRKVDWRLVPMLLVLYLISFIDRANIGMRRSLTCLRDSAD